ncbi:MAG: CDP-glucose 4,6-dehydratase [Candidatus Omnitrophica bacterium]|nr:CDP-glucose 4,6-dehydratase [Candidatus Omnitrophota bacterium]
MEKYLKLYRGLTVLVTGHTGFKGGWLSLWLSYLGARVVGYSLDPPSNPSFFQVCNLKNFVKDIRGDICDFQHLLAVVNSSQPSIIFHLAAQSLVRHSFADPVKTYQTNIIGTLNILEVARQSKSVSAVIAATSDKCYYPRKSRLSYREGDHLGGKDPYSGSKACAEILAETYRCSFYQRSEQQRPLLATVRAGNVIGGGDWGKDRLVPDVIRALVSGKTLVLRYPEAKRPWQHVLDALSAYLLLGSRLYQGNRELATSWNIGPAATGARTVRWMVKQMSKIWGHSCKWEKHQQPDVPENPYLALNSRRARLKLGWKPRFSIKEAIEHTTVWYSKYYHKVNMGKFSLEEIRMYQHPGKRR